MVVATLACQPLVALVELLLLRPLRVLGVTATVARLGPRVHHLDLFDASPHHAVIGVLVGEDTLDGRASQVSTYHLLLVLLPRRWTFVFSHTLVRILSHQLRLLPLVANLSGRLDWFALDRDNFGHFLL